jgi:hypothetical protein
MTLTTHAIVGAAAASLFPEQPVLAFVAGFASHFAIDAIPHWDYKMLSKKINGDEARARPLEQDMVLGKHFLLDLVRIGSDALFGLLLSVGIFYFWLFHIPFLIVAVGAIAGILPDPLQFVYFKTRSKLLEPLQTFHQWIHGYRVKTNPLMGWGMQVLLVALVLTLEKLFI